MTVTIEKAFSTMNIMKNRLHIQMGDQRMNDILIIYLEKYIVHSIDNEVIIQWFQNMKTRRNHL